MTITFLTGDESIVLVSLQRVPVVGERVCICLLKALPAEEQTTTMYGEVTEVHWFYGASTADHEVEVQLK